MSVSTNLLMRHMNIIHLKRYVLLVSYWLVTSPYVLMMMAIATGGLFFAISIYFDQWHWFQRSGALIIIVGAVSSARRILRKGLDCLLSSKSYLDDSLKNSSNEEAQQDIKACYCGFWILGVGTIIWAYGDLVGCLQTLSGSCLY